MSYKKFNSKNKKLKKEKNQKILFAKLENFWKFDVRNRLKFVGKSYKKILFKKIFLFEQKIRNKKNENAKKISLNSTFKYFSS